ncbi:hypothetical protein MKY84_04990 [Chryseomicrobium sp. FSL W7-1435]|uniref:hypothetical protein n=1 Tax=Chryseomicrobium sp. FSL W7-1435 TaxID=2921704 RepID=UPI00315A3A6D
METIRIPAASFHPLSTSSKGDQSKWNLGDIWVKQDVRGYESEAEMLASLLLENSTLHKEDYVSYHPCKIELPSGEVTKGCYSYDFRGRLQEVTLERLFEANFTSTDAILNNTNLSTHQKFEAVFQKVEEFTGLNVRLEVSRLLAFDALILNEDRHTNNIVFLYNASEEEWQLAPIFDNGLSLLSDVKDYPVSRPISILVREVKAKPFASSFSKQLALYEGPPFLHKKAILSKLAETTLQDSQATKVLLSQLKNPKLQRLFLDEEDAR